MGRRRGSGDVHGVLLLDKPSGFTSSAIMRRAQRELAAARSGHAGTLDPLATGLLVVMLGEATKLSPWLMGHDKTYTAEIEFGWETDTLDSDGEVTRREEVSEAHIAELPIEAVLDHLQRQVVQVPPVYSALKRKGKRLMHMARRGEAVKVEPRPCKCHRLTLLERRVRSIRIEVDVGSGFYVRSLARDIGIRLGVPTVLTGLRRTRIGAFKVTEAITPENVSMAAVLPIQQSLGDIPTPRLSHEQAVSIGHGKACPIEAPAGAQLVLACGPEGAPLALMAPSQKVEGYWQVVRGFKRPS